ncbi:MAG: hypothetical protein Q9218_008298, partial [Villophora microphyllina]
MHLPCIKVHTCYVGFDEAAVASLAPDGFFGEVEVEKTAGCGGEERCVGGSAARRNDGDGIGSRGEEFGEVEACPAGANYNDMRLRHGLDHEKGVEEVRRGILGAGVR